MGLGRAGGWGEADASLPSAPRLPSLLTSREDGSSQSFPSGPRYCCSADTVADELLKILHYYSVPSLSLLTPCPAPGLQGPWLSLRDAWSPLARKRQPFPGAPQSAPPRRRRSGSWPEVRTWVPHPAGAGHIWVLGVLCQGVAREVSGFWRHLRGGHLGPGSDRAAPSSCCWSWGSSPASSVTCPSNQIWLQQEQNIILSSRPSLSRESLEEEEEEGRKSRRSGGRR